MESSWRTELFVFVLGLLPAGGVASAQGVGASADLAGTVTDPSGGGLPNAKVTVMDTAKGGQRSVVTDEHGFYRLSGLAPGSYKVSVERSGFQTGIVSAVELSVGQTFILDLHLKLAGVQTQVEVTSQAPIVDTEQGGQANTFSQEYFAQLPIDRRDYLTFTLLAPGVSNSTRLASDQEFRVKQTPQSGLSFYGSNGRGNSVTVDGGEFNDDSGGVRPNLSQDAVQEFQINRSNYTAELGGAGGASINIVSKSGTNRVHGSLFGFFRNDVFDARDPFAFSQALQPGQTFNPLNDLKGAPIKDSLSRQQYGGTLGLPIKRDKSFLFVAFEGLRQDAQNAVPLLTNTNIFRPQTDLANNQETILAALAARGNAPLPAGVSCAGQTTFAACAVGLRTALTVSPTTGLSAAQKARNEFLNNQFERNGGPFPFTTREYQPPRRADHHFHTPTPVSPPHT